MNNKQLLKELKEGFDLVIDKAISKLNEPETAPEYTTGNVDQNKNFISFKDLEDFLDTNYVGSGILYQEIEARRELKTEILNHFKPKQ